VITTIRMALTCHWSARRIHRYLDGERGVPLSADEARRLERHLQVCSHCSVAAREHWVLQRLLGGWSPRLEPDSAAVDRLTRSLDRILAEDQS